MVSWKIKIAFITLTFLFFFPIQIFLLTLSKSSYYLYKGYKLLSQKKIPLAIQYLEESYLTYPFRETYFYLSLAFYLEKDFLNSYKIFKEGFRENEGPAYFYNFLVLLKEMRKTDELLKKAKLAMKKYPFYFKTYLLYLQENQNISKEELLELKKRIDYLWNLRKINGEWNTQLNRHLIKTINLLIERKLKKKRS